MCGKRSCFRESLQRRNQTFQHHGCLAGTGNTGHNRKSSFRNFNIQRFDRMNRVGGHMDLPEGKQFCLRNAGSQGCIGLSGQKRSNHRIWILYKLRDRSLRDDMTASGTGHRSHFNDPVGFTKNLRIVINQHHRVAISNQIMHHSIQTIDVGWVQTDRWLIQYV